MKTEFPGHTGFSVTNIKYAKWWYEFYNQGDKIRQRLVDEFRHQLGEELEMPFYASVFYWLYLYKNLLAVEDAEDKEEDKEVAEGEEGGVPVVETRMETIGKRVDYATEDY